MSIQQFKKDEKIYFIDDKHVDYNIYDAVYKYTTTKMVPIKFKTFNVLVALPDGHTKIIKNTQCFHSYDDAVKGRQEMNNRIIANRLQKRAERQKDIASTKDNISNAKELLSFMLENMHDDANRDIAITKIQEFYGFDLTEVNPKEYEYYD